MRANCASRSEGNEFCKQGMHARSSRGADSEQANKWGGAPDDKDNEEDDRQRQVQGKRRWLVPVQHVVDPLRGGAVVDEHEDEVHRAIHQHCLRSSTLW